MARPKYIEDLHEAAYELFFSSKANEAALRERYEAALKFAAMHSGTNPTDLKAAVARDFGVWIKQERLPRPPRK